MRRVWWMTQDVRSQCTRFWENKPKFAKEFGYWWSGNGCPAQSGISLLNNEIPLDQRFEEGGAKAIRMVHVMAAGSAGSMTMYVNFTRNYDEQESA